jgi:hypothetical protein
VQRRKDWIKKVYDPSFAAFNPLRSLRQNPQFLIYCDYKEMQMANLLILGTYHFANPGLDAVQTQVADVLSEEKQREITAVLTTLASFQPSKIAVETAYDKAESLNQLYTAYRGGSHELTRNEVQQLGFRLAAQLNHDQIYAIDHPGNFIPFEAALTYAIVNTLDYL